MRVPESDRLVVLGYFVGIGAFDENHCFIWVLGVSGDQDGSHAASCPCFGKPFEGRSPRVKVTELLPYQKVLHTTHPETFWQMR